MNTARAYMDKVIRIRTHLLVSQRGKRGSERMWHLIKGLSGWLELWRNATPEQCRQYLSAHRDKFLELIPANQGQQSLIAEMNSIICPPRAAQAAESKSRPIPAKPTPTYQQLTLAI